MNESTNMWLAIIAVSTLVMAVIQVGAILGALIAARRVQAQVTRVEQRLDRQVQPLIDRINVIGADAARISALAVQQAEKADVAFSSATQRVDQTLAVVQNAVVAPAREGMALAAARRAAGEEDDALFIG